MSLKAFHLVFIAAASALALGFGIWELRAYRAEDADPTDLWLGLGSLGAALGLILYGRYVMKKLKKVSYL